MKELEVEAPSARYPVRIGAGAFGQLADLLTGSTAVVVVSDDNVAPLYGAVVCDALHGCRAPILEWVVPSGEDHKSLWQAECLYDFLASKAVDRKGVIIALGGGVVSDLAGFVSSTWLRGIRWINCPTSLLSAVDAALGGKTALNHAGRKNCIGTIHQPAGVLVDPATLTTLEDRHLRSGLAESIKHAYVADPPFAQWQLEHARSINERQAAVLEELIFRSLSIKAQIVARDERDLTGERARLNFGHTIGHALEAVSGYHLTHGECVALGMVGAAYIAEDMKLVDETWAANLKALLERFGLPSEISVDGRIEELLYILRADKKAEDGQLRFVLPDETGVLSSGRVVAEEQVRRALTRLGAQAISNL